MTDPISASPKLIGMSFEANHKPETPVHEHRSIATDGFATSNRASKESLRLGAQLHADIQRRLAARAAIEAAAK